MKDEEIRVPRGRLRRLSKLVGLTARLGKDLVASRAERFLGDEETAKAEAARRILETLGELKGAALKMGQMLSLAGDAMPPEMRRVVSKLFSEAPTLPYAAIAKVVEAELGAGPRAVFAEFEETPFAGASLGQVHRARLRTGERVAVKVQYPGVAEALEDDLRNAAALVRALGIGGSLLDGHDFFDEARREVSAELDYRRERETLERFRGFLARWPDLVVPRSYPEVSTDRVLTMELLEGPTLNELFQTIDAVPPARRFALGERLVRAIYTPFLFHQVIHGDAHPGNFVVMAGDRIGVLDFGCAKELPEPFCRCYRDAYAGVLAGEEPDFLALIRRGGFTIGVSDERARPIVHKIVQIVSGPMRGPYDFGADSMLMQLVAVKRKHALDMLRIRPPPEALLFYRAIVGLSHDLRSLKASGDFRPFFRQALRELEGASSGTDAKERPHPPAPSPPAGKG